MADSENNNTTLPAEHENPGTPGNSQVPGNKAVAPLSASFGINFSLLNTKFHGLFEKNGEEGYAILLMPSREDGDSSLSIGQLVDDIKHLVGGVNDKANTDKLEADLYKNLSGLEGGGDASVLDKLYVKLQMAFLYIKKTKETSDVEYAFQLKVLSKDVIPSEIQNIVDVESVSFSIWNTKRKKVLEQMSLKTISDYLEETDSEQ